MKTAVIIPVHNEGERIYESFEAAAYNPHVNEVIVVDDGSTDNTPEVLKNLGRLTVFTHDTNRGKGQAMDTGMSHAIASGFDVVIFLDGDLHGITPDHVSDLLKPVREDNSQMSIGYLGLRKELVKKAVYRQWGALSGQRAIRTEHWGLLSDQDKQGFKVEAALNARLRKERMHRTIARLALEGVSHVGKHEKFGSWSTALGKYAKAYGPALGTYARIELEGFGQSLRAHFTDTA